MAPLVRLVVPSEKYKSGYIAALRESFAADALKKLTPETVDRIESDFAAHLDKIAREETHPGPGLVPQNHFWLVQDVAFLGYTKVRHGLSPRLRKLGGHIGYEIRPSMRGCGYGTEILRLALKRVRGLGVDDVLITCDDDNLASRRIIENNGGVLDGESMLEDHPRPVLRFWIRRPLRR